MVKTHSEDDIATDNKDLVNITTSRYGNGGKSLENLVVTVRWEGPVEDRFVVPIRRERIKFCI